MQKITQQQIELILNEIIAVNVPSQSLLKIQKLLTELPLIEEKEK